MEAWRWTLCESVSSEVFVAYSMRFLIPRELCGTPLHSKLAAAAPSPSKQTAVHPPPLVHIQFYDNDHSQLVVSVLSVWLVVLAKQETASIKRAKLGGGERMLCCHNM